MGAISEATFDEEVDDNNEEVEEEDKRGTADDAKEAESEKLLGRVDDREAVGPKDAAVPGAFASREAASTTTTPGAEVRHKAGAPNEAGCRPRCMAASPRRRAPMGEGILPMVADEELGAAGVPTGF